jgi:hypothetical protein
MPAMAQPNKVAPAKLPEEQSAHSAKPTAFPPPLNKSPLTNKEKRKITGNLVDASYYDLELVEMGLQVQIDKKTDLLRCLYIVVMLAISSYVTSCQLKQREVFFAATAIKVAFEEDAMWGGFDGDQNVENNVFRDIDSIDHFYVWFREGLLQNVLYAYSPEIEAETTECVLSDQNLGYCMDFWQSSENRRSPSRDWASSMPFYNPQQGKYMVDEGSARGRVGNYNFVMGGLKITQFRGAAGLCTESVLGTMDNTKAQGYSSTFKRTYSSTADALKGAGVFCYSELQPSAESLNEFSDHPQCASTADGILSTDHCVASWSDLWDRPVESILISAIRQYSGLDLGMLFSPPTTHSRYTYFNTATIGSGPTKFFDKTTSADESVNALFGRTIVEDLAFKRYYCSHYAFKRYYTLCTHYALTIHSFKGITGTLAAKQMRAATSRKSARLPTMLIVRTMSIP